MERYYVKLDKLMHDDQTEADSLCRFHFS